MTLFRPRCLAAFMYLVLILASSLALANGQDQWQPWSTKQPHYQPATNSNPPTNLWGTIKAPYPTNVWWQNLVMQDGKDPVSTMPYIVKAIPTGMTVCFPQR